MRTEEKIIENYTDIPALLKNCGARRPFLCCGKSFEKTDAFAYLQAHCRLTVWDTVRPNPRYEDMVAAAELYRKEGCDFIIGAGGGSPLDSAKMIKLLITNPGVVGYDTELRDNDIPFLAIPTTSGTGSEATRYSIFYVNEDEKHSVSHPGFLPGYVLLDPCFLQTVPDYQRKCTCLDALCHAIESYWSVRSTPESRTYAQKAIRLYFEHLDGYLANTPAGNAGMLRASYNAGRAIDFTSTTAAHAMCYNITMHCHTSHGHSVAAGLRQMLRQMERERQDMALMGNAPSAKLIGIPTNDLMRYQQGVFLLLTDFSLMFNGYPTKNIREDFEVTKWILDAEICPALLQMIEREAPWYNYDCLLDVKTGFEKAAKFDL